MRNQQNETGQISLFAQESLMSFDRYSVMKPHLYSPTKEVERLANNLSEFHSLSRSTDPKPSKIAGEKVKVFKQTHIDLIYEALKVGGKMNFQEIAAKANLRPDQVWRRRKEMLDGGWIEVLEETRNGCALWRAK